MYSPVENGRRDSPDIHRHDGVDGDKDVPSRGTIINEHILRRLNVIPKHRNHEVSCMNYIYLPGLRDSILISFVCSSWGFTDLRQESI